MEYLQQELKEANEQLDQNFSRLEAAGLGAVQLAEKLAAAEERIGELEDEVRTLGQRNKASLALVGAQREEQEWVTRLVLNLNAHADNCVDKRLKPG